MSNHKESNDSKAVDVLLQSVDAAVGLAQELEQMNTTLRSLVPCLKLLGKLSTGPTTSLVFAEPRNETESESIVNVLKVKSKGKGGADLLMHVEEDTDSGILDTKLT